MKLLDRELLGDFFRTFLMLEVLLLTLLFAEVTISRFGDIVGSEEGNRLFWAAVYFALRVPRFVVDSSVVAVAASILWNVTRRTRTNEILACLAGGISPMRLSAPLLCGAALVFVGVLALNELVVPEATQRAMHVERRHIQGRAEEDVTRTRNLFQRGAEGRLYLIEVFEPANARMTNVTIIDVNQGTRQPEWILNADVGTLVGPDGGEQWEFENATVRHFDELGRLTSHESHKRLQERDLDRAIEPTLLRFLSNLGRPEYMNSRELRDHVKVLDAQGRNPAEFIVALHAGFALPLAIVIIAMIVCAHVMQPKTQGMLLSFGGGLAWIAGYYAVFVAATRLGETGEVMSPVLAAWLPSAVFGILGIGLLIRSSR